ncbi:MAG TPA: GTPase HflX, partial [Enterococcus sp.]|nr:GTPase HflX [Enterococcus sp.]
TKGKERLSQAIKRELMQLLQPYHLVLAADEGKELNRLKRESLVLTNTFDEETQTYHIKGFALADSSPIRRMEKEE